MVSAQRWAPPKNIESFACFLQFELRETALPVQSALPLSLSAFACECT